MISKEEIISAAKNLALKGGLDSVNIRAVAAYCGVSVGSIYNYFPNKADLMISVVKDYWENIFNPVIHLIDIQLIQPKFSEIVERLFHAAQSSEGYHHSFIIIHPTLLQNKDKKKGRNVMEEYYDYIKSILLKSLQSDKNMKENLWTKNFTQEQFIEFIFSNMIMSLSKCENNCEYLTQIINHILY